ncbi:GatB/YqeY domain-containing protein [Parapedomonas caeni]
MIRDAIKQALVDAMKAKDEKTVSTLRMAQAAIKNRDIELRTATAPVDDDQMVIEVLTKMVKQRRESVEMYEKGGRQELADGEKAEIAIIERFLPAMMSEDEAKAAIAGLVAELGATSAKDMGRVMGALKTRFAGQIDMGRAGALVKAALGA